VGFHFRRWVAAKLLPTLHVTPCYARCLFLRCVVLVDKCGGQQRCPPYLAFIDGINFTLTPIILTSICIAGISKTCLHALVVQHQAISLNTVHTVGPHEFPCEPDFQRPLTCVLHALFGHRWVFVQPLSNFQCV
jgi:hypothetical protein